MLISIILLLNITIILCVVAEDNGYGPSGHVLSGQNHFSVNDYTQNYWLGHALQSEVLNVYHSPAHSFFSYYFSLPAEHKL